jgi:hypothetical protein
MMAGRSAVEFVTGLLRLISAQHPPVQWMLKKYRDFRQQPGSESKR